MALAYNLKPYALQKAITDLGVQETITNLLSAVEANMTAEGLIEDCPKCLTNGVITNQQSQEVECPTCYGWGKTSVQVGSVRTFSPIAPVPPVSLT